MTFSESGHNHFELEGYFAIKPEDQSGSGRHKCSGCAYIIGYYLGYNDLNSFNLEKIIDGLPESQANPQRHHDPKIAANDGYNCGRMDMKQGNTARYSIDSIKNFVDPDFYAYLVSLK